MSYPLDPISAPQERSAFPRPSLGDLKAQLGASAVAASHGARGDGRDDGAPASVARPAPLLDDWTGSFDIHLGIYASD